MSEFRNVNGASSPAGGCSRCHREHDLIDMGVDGMPFRVFFCGICLGELAGELGLVSEERLDAERKALAERITEAHDANLELRQENDQLRYALTSPVPLDGPLKELTDGITAALDHFHRARLRGDDGADRDVRADDARTAGDPAVATVVAAGVSADDDADGLGDDDEVDASLDFLADFGIVRRDDAGA